MIWNYTKELRDLICEAIATTPRGLDYICKHNEGFPCAATVHKMLNEHQDFLESYLRARERQADLIFDECLQIADEAQTEAIVGELLVKYDATAVSRNKLRVDTRMRMAGKLSPKKYGDSTQVKHADAHGNKLDATTLLATLDGRSSGLPEIKG